MIFIEFETRLVNLNRNNLKNVFYIVDLEWTSKPQSNLMKFDGV